MPAWQGPSGFCPFRSETCRRLATCVFSVGFFNGKARGFAGLTTAESPFVPVSGVLFALIKSALFISLMRSTKQESRSTGSGTRT